MCPVWPQTGCAPLALLLYASLPGLAVFCIVFAHKPASFPVWWTGLVPVGAPPNNHCDLTVNQTDYQHHPGTPEAGLQVICATLTPQFLSMFWRASTIANMECTLASVGTGIHTVALSAWTRIKSSLVQCCKNLHDDFRCMCGPSCVARCSQGERPASSGRCFTDPSLCCPGKQPASTCFSRSHKLCGRLASAFALFHAPLNPARGQPLASPNNSFKAVNNP